MQTARFPKCFVPWIIVLASAEWLVGCRCSDGADPPSSAASALSASAKTKVVRPPAEKPRYPVGHKLAILRGKGVGPIRFGATVATIERLMEAPCDIKTEEVCRYFEQAIEFFLKDGVVSEMYLHAVERDAGKDAQGKPRTYGVFNGAIPPDLMFGMLPFAIEEGLGKAQRVEKLDESGPYHTAERHYYDGIMIEYDRYKNGNLAAGGMRITPSATVPDNLMHPGKPAAAPPLSSAG